MKHHSVLTRLLTLFLVLLTVAAVPLNVFAAETSLPVPTEDGEDPMSGISLFAYNYNRIPEEMMDNSAITCTDAEIVAKSTDNVNACFGLCAVIR